MKRITTLLLAAIFMISGAVVGHAESNIDVKVKGQWDFVFGWADNVNHFKQKKGYRYRDDDNGTAAQRIRTQINFIASENLQGVLMFEIGDIHWGQGDNHGRGAGGRVGADGVNIETKHAYLDWMVPSTDLHIRMGIQGLALPMATGLGNPVFDDDVAAIVANYKFDDTFSLTAFWARPYNYTNNDRSYGRDQYNRNRSIDDEMDMFGLIAPVSLDGVTITPWGVWANIGDGSGFFEDVLGTGRANDNAYNDVPGLSGKNDKRTTAWWAGLGVAVDLWDPLTFAVDAMYGHMQAATFAGNDATDALGGIPRKHNEARMGTEGWFLAANLDYKLDWGTPGLFGWWASGDDYSDVNKHGMRGRMPTYATSSGFAPTTFGWDGGFGISETNALGISGTGTWGIGIQIADMSFIEDLTHTIRFAYMQGTNDAKIVRNGLDVRFTDDFYLTDKDSAFEINFDHKYQIYENLAAVLELGYINMDLDRKTWNNNPAKNRFSNTGTGTHRTDDAWKAQLSFQYKF